MMLVGPQPVGTWVVNFLGSAREILTEAEADLINSAFDGLDAVLAGETDIDRFFPGLVPAAEKPMGPVS